MDTIIKDITAQRNFFQTGKSKNIMYRKKQLQLLKKVILENEKEISMALKKDLNKSEFESYATEIGIVLEEINFMIKKINKFSARRKVSTPLMHFPSKSYIYKEPFGVVLIIAPWNYPFQLAIAPLIGAIAAGNCAIIKPSENSPFTSAILSTIINDNFDRNYISVVEGGIETNKSLLDIKFDLIFFTGSVPVGKIVMQKAANHLTPVILELGGKSPCIVDEFANIPLAAKRIIWGKSVNAGQTCVAPDYILVHKNIKEQLLIELKKNIINMFGEHSEQNVDYPKIINTKNLDRQLSLIQSGDVYFGGEHNVQTNQVALTIMDNVTWNDTIMEQEIFGPILPVISFDSLEDSLETINSRPKPLALYLFSTNTKNKKTVLDTVSFGGGCINDTLVHFVSSSLPFGGVGESGMGNYHGRANFEAFTHEKGILEKSNLLDIPIRYAPFKNNIKLLKRFLG